MTEIQEDTDTTILLEEDWPLTCQHFNHPRGTRGHSDESPVMVVAGLPCPNCGYRSAANYLCQSWIQANPTLRCSRCNVGGVLFEDFFTVLGAV